VTIETKAPFKKSSAKERDIFVSRLMAVPTLRVAYFTNGPEWDRLDVSAPEGNFFIHQEVSIDVASASAEEAESFFTPLRADRYFQWGSRNRSLVSRAQRHILEQLARDLDEIVLDLTSVLESIFTQYRSGSAGPDIKHSHSIAI